MRYHNGIVYAANITNKEEGNGVIEIYSNSIGTWQVARKIIIPEEEPEGLSEGLPKQDDIIKLWVNNEMVFASSFDRNELYSGTHETVIMSKATVQTEDNIKLFRPLICHGNDEQSVLIADLGNNSLVLFREGRYSRIGINDLRWPQSAVYIHGRLYIVENKDVQSYISVYLPEFQRE